METVALVILLSILFGLTLGVGITTVGLTTTQHSDVLCTPQMISDLKEARASHQYFLDNYHPEYYNFTSEFQSLSAKETERKAQAWERRWINVYDTLLGSCKI